MLFRSGLEWLAGEWRKRELFRFPLNRQSLFQNLYEIVRGRDKGTYQARLIESLAYDYALCERVVTNRIPEFFDTALEPEEDQWVRAKVQEKTEAIKGQGIKLQYFAATFSTIHSPAQRTIYLFCYLTGTGRKLQVDEYRYSD